MLLLLMLAASVVSSSASSSPDCPRSCGNVSILPFGIGPGCFKLGFQITCNGTGASSSFTPYLGDGNSQNEVISISLLTGQARIKMYIASSCYLFNQTTPRTFPGTTDLTGTPYVFSDTHNKFVAVGCDTLAYIKSSSQKKYRGGCMSICESKNDFMTIKSSACFDGVTCCQSSIRKRISFFEVEFDTIANRSSDSNVHYPCSYALLTDPDWIHQHQSRFYQSGYYDDGFFWSLNKFSEVVLDWAIRDQNSCNEAKLKKETYACLSSYSECVDSINGPGYICNCSSGFHGNPYVLNGCQDINECNFPDVYPCYGDCTNTLGGYECSCPRGTQGNASLVACTSVPEKQGRTVIITGVCVPVSTLLLIFMSTILWRVVKKRKERIRKEKYLQKNLKLLQEDQNFSDVDLAERMKIFSLEELRKATNDFDKERIVGGGGHGQVYKGILADQRVVAIKRPKIQDENELKQYINEVYIISQTNHRNVVKFFGCCLESEVPLLVFEFISGGTLYDHLRHYDRFSPLPFKDRLRIVT